MIVMAVMIVIATVLRLERIPFRRLKSAHVRFRTSVPARHEDIRNDPLFKHLVAKHVQAMHCSVCLWGPAGHYCSGQAP